MKTKPIFAEGDRIVVLQHSEYRSRYTDEFGTVESVYRVKSNHYVYGVKLDNHINNQSGKGLFWFEANHIKTEKEYEREEHFMFNNFAVAEIEFLDNPNSDRICYALFDDTIVPEDMVVVSTGHHGFAVARVANIHTAPEMRKKVKHNREVVCKADFTHFYARKDAVKKALELKQSMEQRIREAQEIALYEALAEKDPELKGMLEKYKALMEVCK